MTSATTTDGTISSSIFMPGTANHTDMMAILKGERLDLALKAMSYSAASKKPGRVLERIAKAMGPQFPQPRLVTWEKAEKTVLVSCSSKGILSEVCVPVPGVPETEALFQTDIYFRDNRSVTEVNATTVAGICRGAVEGLAKALKEGETIEAGLRRALTSARILQTGFAAAGLATDRAHDILVPLGSDVMRIICLPIERIDLDEVGVGQVAMIAEICPAGDMHAETRKNLEDLGLAMTREGHPGEEGFGRLIARVAKPAGTFAQKDAM